MKTWPQLLFVLADLTVLASATGCESVIDLDLKETEAKVVIEGNLANDGRPATVQITRSANYDDTNSFPAVSGAVVTLRDDTGNQETLRETSPGQYRGATVLGTSGRRYTLRVETGGQVFAATALLPPPVPFTGLRVEESSFGGNDELLAVPEYQDPAGPGNYYVFRQYRNGRLNQSVFLQDDEFTDGRQNTRALNSRGGDDDEDTGAESDELVAGDTLRVDMQSVDRPVYEYWRTLNQILASNPLFSTTPANPLTNFSGGALGYFSAHTLQTRRIVVD